MIKVLHNFRFWLTCFGLLTGISSAQAQKEILRAEKLFNQNRYDEAIPIYLKEVTDNTKNIDIMVRLADCYRLSNHLQEAEEWYYKIHRKKPKDPESLFNYAQALKSNGKYAEAKVQFLKYKTLKPDDPRGTVFAVSCELALIWANKVDEVEVREVKYLNTKEPEFSPAFYKNGLVFASSMKGGKRKFISLEGGAGDIKLDLYYAPIDGTIKNLTKPKSSLFSSINTSSHEATVSFSPDKKVLYFTRSIEGEKNKKREVLSTLQIFKSEQNESAWSTPKSVAPFNNSAYSTGHPSLSTLGNSMVFMSDMPGGFGGTDLYISHLIDSEWSQPENLGPDVNTYDHELFPYYSNDTTIYFSSNGHPGMGRLDIFYTTYDKKLKKWSNVTNLEPPINSTGDDFSIILNKNHSSGFFSSNRKGGSGSDDIYCFKIKEPLELIRLDSTIVIRDMGLYTGISIEIYNESDNQKEKTLVKDGKFIMTINTNKEYSIMAKKDGILINKIRVILEKKPEFEFMIMKVHPMDLPVSVSSFVFHDIFNGNKSDIDHLQTDTAILQKKKNKTLSVAVKAITHGQIFNEVKANSDKKYSYNLNLDAGAEYRILSGMDAMRFMNETGGEDFSKDLAEIEKQKKPAPVAKQNLVKVDSSIIKKNIPEIQYTTLSGTLKDPNQKPVSDARLELINKQTVVDETITKDDGKYVFKINPNEDYSITTSKEGYFKKEITIAKGGKKGELDIAMEEIVLNKPIVLENIYYDYNRWEIRKDAALELDKLVKTLTLNPQINIELSSHTDSIGTFDYNVNLSQKRAESAVKYLYSKGIDTKKIYAKGYGESFLLIKDASTEAGHQKNRRTEFKVTEIKENYSGSYDQDFEKVIAMISEKDRLIKEQMEKEKIEREKAEKEKIEKEKAEREKIGKEKDEKEKAEREKIEKEKIEKENVEREKKEKERMEREAHTKELAIKTASITKGLVFKIQLGAFSKKLSAGHFGNLKDITTQTTPGGLLRYLSGNFKDMNQAVEHRDKIRNMGYKEAIIIAEKDGLRISLSKLTEEIKNIDLSQLNSNPKGNPTDNVTHSQIIHKKGISYRIQLGVFSKLLPQSKFNDINDLLFEKTENGLYRYMTGEYSDLGSAEIRKYNLIVSGYKDLMIIAFKDGKRVSLGEAKKEEK